MVRSVDTFFINGESFINYCSDSDFNYTIYIGQKCKVLRNGKCFIGTLYEVDSNKNTFSIKQNNGEIIEINCADVEEIFSEEEIGTINLNISKQPCVVCKNHKANEPFAIRDDKGILYKTSNISCCPYCGRYLKENYIN